MTKTTKAKTKFVIYERLRRNTPSFSGVIDVGDKVFQFEARLEASQGRSSLVGTLSEIKQLKVWEGSEMLHVLPRGPLLEGNVESDTVSAPESSWLTTPLEPPL